MLSSIITDKISSLLIDIFGANIPLPLKIFHDLEEKEDLSELSNILQINNIIDQLVNSYQFHIKFEILKCVDYKNLRKPSKAILLSDNVFHAKYIS